MAGVSKEDRRRAEARGRRRKVRLAKALVIAMLVAVIAAIAFMQLYYG